MVLHTQILNEESIEFAMLSRLFYSRTVHREPSSKAHSNVAYSVEPDYIRIHSEPYFTLSGYFGGRFLIAH